MRIGYYQQLPVKNNSINQTKTKAEQKTEVKNVFQQMLSQEQAINSNSTTHLYKEAKATENPVITEEKVLSNFQVSDELLYEETLNHGWIELLINHLPNNLVDSINEKLKMDLPVLSSLKDDFKGSDSEEAVLMLLSLFQIERATFTEKDQETLTKLKIQLEKIFNVSLPIEEASVESFIQSIVKKPNENNNIKIAGWPGTKENDLPKDFHMEQLNKPLAFHQQSGESISPLWQTSKNVFVQPLADHLHKLIASKLENNIGKVEENSLILTDHNMTTLSLPQERMPVISLNETAPKPIVNQQFVQQLLEIMRGSKFTQLGNGQSQLVVRLHPEHLGSLTIKLVQENGELMAKIITSTASAKELIEANIHQIRHAIPAQNITIEKFDIFTQQQTYEQSYREQQQESREQQHTRQEQHNGSNQNEEDESNFKDAFAVELLNLRA
ncbi:MAG TPA: flagellar hook-length control protein FliK [Anoxybacillus sp.]|nr:flagellar hook-length control protein FliK [Anoxybacillus sp.]